MTAAGEEVLPSVRHPNLWADAQREFASDVPDTAPRTAVHAGWWSTKESGVARWWHGSGLVALALLPIYLWAVARRMRQGPPGGFVAIFRSEADANAGDAPILLCEVRPHDLPSSQGRGDATVVGELARNGALAIEVEGRHLFPIHHPAAPTFEERRACKRLFSATG